MNKLIKNSIFNVLKVTSTLLFPLLTYTYVARIFEVNIMGQIEFSRSFNSYFVLTAMLGIINYGVREASRRRDDRLELSKFTHEIMIINFISSLVSFFVYLIIIFNFNHFNNYTEILLIYSILILVTMYSIDWLFTALEDFKYISLRTILVQFLSFLSVFIFINSKDDVYLYVFIQVVAITLSNGFNLYHSRKYVEWKYIGNYQLRKHLKSIFILFFMTISVQIFSYLDSTMLSFFGSDRSVGLYSAATKMTNIVTSMLVAIISILSPRISLYFDREKWDEIKKIALDSLKLILMLSIPSALGVFLLSEELIVIFGGETFIDGVVASRLLSLRIILSPLNTFFVVQLFISMNKERFNLVSTGVAAILNIMLNFLLIPTFLQNGAAIATVLAELAQLILNIYFSRNIIYFKLLILPSIKYLFASLMIIIIYMLFGGTFNHLVILGIYVLISMLGYFLTLLFVKDEMVMMLFNQLKSRISHFKK